MLPKQAQISETIENLEKKYKTNVGQGGILLSGGQRQRIGIARALYKNANVIIFDEATSALDNETEKAVMHSIEALSEDLTIIIVAHRISTLKNCSKIIEIANNKIKQIGNYQEFITTLNY
jgi:ATP-binding cassette subfamily B protein